MAKIDYIEFKLTDYEGNITYSQATQHILPPLMDKYETIEQINNLENGQTQTFKLK